MPALRIVVEGAVQGVGFRAFVCRRAKLFGVSGRVWNRGDGSVEAFAVFPEIAPLETFAASLERGPSTVRSVFTENAPEPEVEPMGFSISPTM